VTDIDRVPLTEEQLRQNRFHHDVGPLGTPWLGKDANPETSAWLVRAASILDDVAALLRAQAVQGRLLAGSSIDDVAAELELPRDVVAGIVDQGHYELARGTQAGRTVALEAHSAILRIGHDADLLGPDRPAAPSPESLSAALVRHWLKQRGLDVDALTIEEHIRASHELGDDGETEATYLEQYVTVVSGSDDEREAVRDTLEKVGLTTGTSSEAPDVDRFYLSRGDGA